MKTLVATALAIASLTGCTIEATVPTTEAPAPSNTQDYGDPGVVEGSDDLAFLSIIKSEYPFLESEFSDAWLIDLGWTICGAIGEGLDLAGLAAMAVDGDMDPEMVGYITGAAIGAYCPQFSDFFDGI